MEFFEILLLYALYNDVCKFAYLGGQKNLETKDLLPTRVPIKLLWGYGGVKSIIIKRSMSVR